MKTIKPANDHEAKQRLRSTKKKKKKKEKSNNTKYEAVIMTWNGCKVPNFIDAGCLLSRGNVAFGFDFEYAENKRMKINDHKTTTTIAIIIINCWNSPETRRHVASARLKSFRSRNCSNNSGNKCALNKKKRFHRLIEFQYFNWN